MVCPEDIHWKVRPLSLERPPGGAPAHPPRHTHTWAAHGCIDRSGLPCALTPKWRSLPCPEHVWVGAPRWRSRDRQRQALECAGQSSDRLWRTQDSALNCPVGRTRGFREQQQGEKSTGIRLTQRQRQEQRGFQGLREARLYTCGLLGSALLPPPSSPVSVPSVHSPPPGLYKRVLR